MDIAEKARLAYIQGWVESGGPMTERVKAGCRVAVEAAKAHPDRDDLFEATLQIGKLEGHWAQVFADREAVVDHYLPLIIEAFRRLMKTVHIRAEIARFRNQTGLDGSTRQTDPATAAAIAAMRIVHQGADPANPAYSDAADVLADAITAAEDAGDDAGQLVAGGEDNQGAQSRSSADRQALGVAALLALIRGTTTNVGRKLTTLAQVPDKYFDSNTGAITDLAGLPSEADMIRQVEDTIHGEGETASRVLGDQAVITGFMHGMLGAFVARGMRMINWVTAGDGKVCPTCQRYEDRSPYPAITFPAQPHPNCRCVPEPAS